MPNVTRTLAGLLISLAAACDADPRVATRFDAGRSESRATTGDGGAGGAEHGLDDGETSDDEPLDDVAEGACPLGSTRDCKAATDAGCLEGTQYCADGVWSACLRDVSRGEGSGGG